MYPRVFCAFVVTSVEHSPATGACLVEEIFLTSVRFVLSEVIPEFG